MDRKPRAGKSAADASRRKVACKSNEPESGWQEVDGRKAVRQCQKPEAPGDAFVDLACNRERAGLFKALEGNSPVGLETILQEHRVGKYQRKLIVLDLVLHTKIRVAET